jgi:uncharacterized protein (TIGR00725 family)
MNPHRIRTVIGVIGAGNASEEGCADARLVGRLIAEGGASLVCGGLGGIMAAASQGAAEAGGEVIGILPGGDTRQANPWVTVAIATNMGHARNIIIAHTAQALIAVEGEYGTLSEMAIGLKLGKPVIALRRRLDIPGAITAPSPSEAVFMAFQRLREPG